jgi:hypothetical protein
MKISLSIIASILTIFTHAQQSPTLKAILVSQVGEGRQVPQRFDSVFLNKTYNKTGKIYTKISANDNSFIITDVPIGKYWLQFSVRDFCVASIPIVVCSRCDNQFALHASPKKEGAYCDLFTMVEVSPSYVTGFKGLSKDFQRSLSKAEKKRLKAREDFTVNFYLTKEGVISDPSFVAPNQPADIKSIVLKGLGALTNWRPAKRNGTAVDAEFSLTKGDLLNK